MLHTAAEGRTATEGDRGGGGVPGRVTWGLGRGRGGGGGGGVEREDLSGTVGAAHAPRLLISPSFSRSRLHLRMVWDGTHVPDFAPAYLTKGT